MNVYVNGGYNSSKYVAFSVLCSLSLVLLGAFAKLRKTTIYFVVTRVCPYAWNNSTPTGRIFMKFLYLCVFRKSMEKMQVSLKSDKNKGYFR
jgi:hypothetical protein